MAIEIKSRSDLVGKRFLCIYANHCVEHSDGNNNKTTNSNQSYLNSSPTNFLSIITKDKLKSRDCTEKCFNTIQKLKSTKIQNWPWRSGIIRASSHRDSRNPDLTVNY